MHRLPADGSSAPPAALLARISPVLCAARGQLRTLKRPTARGAAAGTVVVADGLLYVREVSCRLPFRHRWRGATDVAVASTFRELPGAHASEQNTVSFEPFGRPGCLWRPAGGVPGDASPPPSPSRARQQPPQPSPAHPLQLRLVCGGPSAPLSAADAAATWRRHDPLVSTAHGSFQSYESRARRVLHVHARRRQPDASAAPHARRPADAAVAAASLTPLLLVRKPPPPPPPKAGGPDLRFTRQGVCARVVVRRGLGEAEYPPSAFGSRRRRAEAALPSALLYPLNEVVDEHYSVYFDFGA